MAKVIGLTGGIASGKSTARRFFSQQGIPTIDSDTIAREVVEPDQAGLVGIIKLFGPEYLLPDGRLDRAKLGQLVFSQPAAKNQLDAFLGPIIRRELVQRIAEAKKATAEIVIVDIPLLFEHHYQELLDGVLVITVDQETQLERLMVRNQLSATAAQQRIEAQDPLVEKCQKADWVIDNTPEPAILATKLKKWLDEQLAAEKT